LSPISILGAIEDGHGVGRTIVAWTGQCGTAVGRREKGYGRFVKGLVEKGPGKSMLGVSEMLSGEEFARL